MSINQILRTGDEENNLSEGILGNEFFEEIAGELSDSLSNLWESDFEEISWDDKNIELPESLKGIGKIYKLPEEWKKIIQNSFESEKIGSKVFCMIGNDREYVVAIQNGEFYIVLGLNLARVEVIADKDLSKLYKDSYDCLDSDINKIILQRFPKHIAYLLDNLFSYYDDEGVEIKQSYEEDLDSGISTYFRKKIEIQKDNMMFTAKKRKIKIEDIYNLELPYQAIDGYQYMTPRGVEGLVSKPIDRYGDSDRLDNIGKFVSNDSILAFVGPTGELYITKSTIEHQKELESIGYKKGDFGAPFSNGEVNAFVDSFKYEHF